MAGRPMKPIPSTADPAAAEFATYLRLELQRLMDPGTPMSRLAEHGGIGKSTLMHALGGERFPTPRTLAAMADAVAALTSLTDQERWEVKQQWLERAHEARRATEEPGRRLRWEPKESKATRESAEPESVAMNLTARPEDVELWAAQAALDQALERLEEATQDVARARKQLQRFTQIRGRGVRVLGADASTPAAAAEFRESLGISPKVFRKALRTAREEEQRAARAGKPTGRAEDAPAPADDSEEFFRREIPHYQPYQCIVSESERPEEGRERLLEAVENLASAMYERGRRDMISAAQEREEGFVGELANRVEETSE
ncbi:hypothetical protein ACIO3O_37685 [Streptomyces sp. NPDC087440]|uniref:hypothetical protein n=1 Tax=Streptomyces sp. NPDC087440 TaxID=3365790 RepID=UPI003805EB18